MHKFATIALAALALTACDAEPTDAATENLPVDQATPPGAGGLTMTVEGTMENGNQMTFIVEGAQPNENVYLVFGTQTIAATMNAPLCPPALNNLCFDIDAPRLMGIPQNPLRANANGIAILTLNAPPASILPDGFTAFFQAATLGGTAATSNIVGKFNPLDAGGVFAIDIYAEGTVQPGVNYTAQGFEFDYSTANGFDICVITWDEQSVAANGGLGTLPACPGCTFAFQLDRTNFREDQGIGSGDCAYFFNGFDPSTIAADQTDIGYNPAYYVAGYGNYPAAMGYITAQTAWLPISFATYYQNGNFAWLADDIAQYAY